MEHRYNGAIMLDGQMVKCGHEGVALGRVVYVLDEVRGAV